MDARAIALAIPFFFALMVLELAVNRRRGASRYRLHDAIASLSCGVGQQILGVLTAATKVAGYAFVYDHLRVTTLSPRAPAAWIALLFGVDLGYWTYHWVSHRVNFFWASHAVHHQSEEYNLSTALRQSWFTGFTSWIFYLPLAVLGFPPAMFLLMYTLNILYQFWIHTRALGHLGVLEGLLNTPSHHRVHHGIDPLYIDRNYAGIFIVWDRLFGTFQREEREPVYGTVQPLASWDPFWANLEPWVKLVEAARRTRRLRDKVWIFFAPPEWRPADLGGPVTIPEVSRATQRRFDTRAPRGLDAYVLVGFALASLATTALLWFDDALAPLAVGGAAASIFLALLGWGALFEAKPWAVPFEWARLGLAVAYGAWMTRGTAALAPVTALALVVALALGIWVGRYRGRRPELVSVPPEAA